MTQALQDCTPLHIAVAQYYRQTLRRHGATPAGADWLSAAGQDLRLALLLRVCNLDWPFSLNDLGCGYGALPDYLLSRHPGLQLDYLGIDVSREMVACAARRFRNHPAPHPLKICFKQGCAAPRVADYAVASGIFNVVPAAAEGLWTGLIAQTLSGLHATTRHGFAVNFMRDTPGEPREPGLYQTSPAPWVAYCERELGTTITVLEDYALNEFTILARRRRPVGFSLLE